MLCSNRVARHAEVYTDELCMAILNGLINQLEANGEYMHGCFGLQAAVEVPDASPVAKTPENGFSGKYRDDLTKQILRDDLVIEARRKELEYFTSKGVWCKRPRREAFARTGRKPVTVRWVDINKGDDIAPRYRSRLVARQLKCQDKSGESFFSPTPPLESLRAVISLAATEVEGWKPCLDDSDQRTQVSLIDISRAYFNAVTDEQDPTYVELPPEEDGFGELVGLLLRHMYGTRRAADGWQQEYSTSLIEMGFVQGISCACVFYHKERQLRTTVHGDDFTTTGPKVSQDWLEEELRRRYELTAAPRLGPGKDDAKEGLILNRVVRWTDSGLELEADPRQAEKLVDECGLTGATPVCTPGVKPAGNLILSDEPLEPRLSTPFRGSAARANYLCADRLDCQFASKEICRHMAAPSKLSWQALKRLGRYLAGAPRLVYTYKWQKADTIEVYSDTDWAGCGKTRKSTSGGVAMVGAHAVKTWSSTQPQVSLSSGEAEFYGTVRASGMGLGFQSLLRDLGCELKVRVWTDSSAAIGICTRQGLGKLRHLDTQTLWIQQAVRSGRVDLRKIGGDVNPADLLTKHMSSQDKLRKLVELFGCRFDTGRAAAAPQLRRDPTDKLTMAGANSLSATTTADNHDHNDEDSNWTATTLPHLTSTNLQAEYPPISVPEDVLPDVDADQEDATYQQGMVIASEIAHEMLTRGRVRYSEA